MTSPGDSTLYRHLTGDDLLRLLCTLQELQWREQQRTNALLDAIDRKLPERLAVQRDPGWPL